MESSIDEEYTPQRRYEKELHFMVIMGTPTTMGVSVEAWGWPHVLST